MTTEINGREDRGFQAVRKRLLLSTAICGGLFVAQATTAILRAQEAGEQADSGVTLEEVVITGSRIKRSGATAPAPTTMVSSEDIALSGAIDVQSLLNELPSIAPGIQANNSGNFSFALAGLNMINLRDLDVRRTLVLVNGRRFTPTLTDADTNITAVDLAAIPTPMIDRIEVITGGAGAVYGSDAVAGVVNIILKKKFEGMQFDGQYGVSGEGDADNYSFSVTGGTNWSDGRGNTVLHFGYAENSRVKLADRDFIVNRLDSFSNPEDTGPGDGIPAYIIMEGLNRAGTAANVVNFYADRSTTPDANGNFTTAGDTARFAIDPNTGAVRVFDGTPTPSLFRYEGGKDGSPVADADLIVPVKRYTMAANTSYQIFDNVEGFVELNYSLTRTSNRITPVFQCQDCFRAGIDGRLVSRLPADHPFVLATPGLAALLAGDPNTTDDDITEIEPDRSNIEFGQRGTDIDRDIWQFVGGLRGDIDDNWNWELSYQIGESRITSTSVNDVVEPNFYEAVMNVEADPNNPGQLRCASEVARAHGCVPFNILSNKLQQDAVDYVTTDHTSRSRFRQSVINGYVSGDLLQLPAGPVGVATGFEYRKEDVNIDQSSLYNSGDGFFGSLLPDLTGSTDVYEIYGEARVPLLKDLPMVQDLSVEGAVRWADYSSSGGVLSWNVGGDWTIVDDIRIRGAYARAVRAPKVGELFTPATNSASSVTDPCDAARINDTPNRAANCAALGVPSGFIAPDITTGVIISGNENLDVEKGDTYTIGAVLQPRWIENLTLTIDYWNIKIKDAITLFPFSDVLNNCVDAPSINNDFCSQVSRQPNGAVDRVSSTFINASVFQTSGIDFEANYRFDLASIDESMDGMVSLNAIATYLRKRDFILNPEGAGDATIADPKAGEHGTPKWRGSVNGRYTNGRFDFNSQFRWVGSTVSDVTADPESLGALETGREYYVDLQARYQVLDELSVYAGVNNVFDNAPPRHPSVFSGTGRLDSPSQVGAALYDVIGRFFYVGSQVKF